MKTGNIKTQEIIPGRAKLIELEGHGDQIIRILGVYAPNSPAENAAFWKAIWEFFERHPNIELPDYFAGDMNIVEDAIDRLPARNDPDTAVAELDQLKTHLGMVDGWRQTYPNKRAYTYTQSRRNGEGSHSRIDRIYVRHETLRQSYEWRIRTLALQRITEWYRSEYPTTRHQQQVQADGFGLYIL